MNKAQQNQMSMFNAVDDTFSTYNSVPDTKPTIDGESSEFNIDRRLRTRDGKSLKS